MSQIIISNLTAGNDINVQIQALLERDDRSAELRRVLEDEFQRQHRDIAETVAEQLQAALPNIVSDIHVRQSDRGKVNEAITHTIWGSVSHNGISAFELEPHLRKLTDFCAAIPDIYTRFRSPEYKPALKDLPKLFLELSEETDNRQLKAHLDYLRGVTLFLNHAYGDALKILDPLTRQGLDLPTLMLAGEAALNIGLYAAALKHFEAARDINSDFGDNRTFRYALLTQNIGACYEEALDSEKAVDRYRQALSTIPNESEDRLSRLIRALIKNNLGFSLMTISDKTPATNNLHQAEALFKEALRLRQNAHDSPPNIASIMFNLAEVHRKQSNLADAEEWLDRAEGRMDDYDKKHILFASIWNAKGQALFDERHYCKAIEQFRKARRVLETNLGETNLKFAFTTYSMSQAYEALGDYERARQTLLRARTTALAAVGKKSHPFIKMVDEDLANPQI